MNSRTWDMSKSILAILVLALLVSNVLWTFSSQNVRGDDGTPRTVVVELFTATWCVTCPYADEAADMLLTDYGPERISVLQYHVNYPLDPMANTDSTNRGYAYDTNITGLPAAYFDGMEDVTGVGESNVNFFYDEYKDKIDARLGDRSPVSLSVSMSESSGNVTVTASFERAGSITASDPIYARYVLYENLLQHDSHVYNYVVRGVEGRSFDYNGLPYNENVGFELQSGWDPTNMGVVVFVQIGNTGEVLQSASSVLGPRPTVTLTTELDGKEISGVTKIEGTASQDVTVVEVRIDGQLYVAAQGTINWEFDINPSDLSGGSHTLSVRAYSDSLAYSDLVEAEFEVAEGSMIWIIIVVIIVVIVIILSMIVIKRRKKDQGE